MLAVGIIFSLVSVNAFAAVNQLSKKVYYYDQEGNPINPSEFNLTGEKQPVNLSEDNETSYRQDFVNDVAEGKGNFTEGELKKIGGEPIDGVVLYDFESKFPSQAEERERFLEEWANIENATHSFKITEDQGEAMIGEFNKESAFGEGAYSGEYALKLASDSNCRLPFYVPADSIDNLSNYNLVFRLCALKTAILPQKAHLKVSLKDRNGNIIPGTERNIYDFPYGGIDGCEKQEISLSDIPDINEISTIELSNEETGGKTIYADLFELEREEILAEAPKLEEEKQKKGWRAWIGRRIEGIKMFFGLD